MARQAACGSRSEVGNVGVDWTGNDISIDAVADPEVDGVVCHLAYFNRSFIDRISQGNWFEDPSYSALDCSVTGPITHSNRSTWWMAWFMTAPPPSSRHVPRQSAWS